MTHFLLEPIYGSALLAIVIAVATVALVALVTPPAANQRRRRWLIGLRSAAALAILLAIFRPTLQQRDNRPADATLVVAVDTSRSMTLPDGDRGDRWRSQVDCWQQLAAGLSELDSSLSLRLLAYDREARSLTDTSETALDEMSPAGDLTDLAAVTSAAIQAAQGSPIAGVVLMGDGAQTAPIRGSGAQRVVETLASIGVPLWCVPIGPAGGANDNRDVAVNALAESLQLFAGNQVDISFEVLSRGLVGVGIPVRISWLSADGSTEEVAVRTVVPEQADDAAALTIGLIAPPPGTYRLKVEAAPQSGEIVTVNNSQVAFVDVREGGGRILYLEGWPREEQLRIRQSLRGFPDLDMTYRWIPADTTSQWPIDLDDWFQPGRFDVYIIGDLDAAALGQQQLDQLSESVSRGAGLLMLGGLHTFGPGGYGDSPLADVIPIQIDRSLRRDVAATPSDDAGQLQPPLTIRLARAHDITDLGGDDPALVWQQLPAPLGANRFVGPKVAPGVQVLLETEDQHPLMVIGESGRGRSAAVAFDSTYLWWRDGKRQLHKRFWRQTLLWLLNREDLGEDNIRIELDSRRFDIANPPPFRASVQSLGQPQADVDLVAEVIDSKGVATPVAVSTDANLGGITGQLPQLPSGFYQLRVRPAADDSELPVQEVAFQVIDQSRELARPMADPVYLRQLASLTADHGGAAFSTDEIDQLVKTISQRRRQAETPVIERHRLGEGPWSGWIVFLIFASALSVEWVLRRRWGIA